MVKFDVPARPSPTPPRGDRTKKRPQPAPGCGRSSFTGRNRLAAKT